MKKMVLKLLPQRSKNKLKEKLKHKKYSEMLKNINPTKAGDKLFIIGVPEHGNLGDQAIIKAEIEYLNTFFPMYEIIEIPSQMVRFNLKELERKIKEEDIICLHGGGYLGTIWPEEEEMARTVIKNFKNNKIVVFPQTIYYEDTEFGEQFLDTSKKIYNSHPKLYLCAREKKTYNAFKKYYPNVNAVLVPDIVLYLNESKKQRVSQGMLVCFRTDKEAITTDDVRSKLELLSSKLKLKITYTDTTVNREVTKNNRDKELENKFEEFRKAEVVITDRLHGMIFSVITGTPCVAMNNKSGKVKGVYQWVKNLNYIKFIETPENLEQAIKEVCAMEYTEYNNKDLIKSYKPLEKILVK